MSRTWTSLLLVFLVQMVPTDGIVRSAAETTARDDSETVQTVASMDQEGDREEGALLENDEERNGQDEAQEKGEEEEDPAYFLEEGYEEEEEQEVEEGHEEEFDEGDEDDSEEEEEDDDDDDEEEQDAEEDEDADAEEDEDESDEEDNAEDDEDGENDKDFDDEDLKATGYDMDSDEVLTAHDIDNLIEDYDGNKDDKISWLELMKLISNTEDAAHPGESTPEAPNGLEEAFAGADEDEDRVLDRNELKQLAMLIDERQIEI